jgi:hypothetical protein
MLVLHIIPTIAEKSVNFKWPNTLLSCSSPTDSETHLVFGACYNPWTGAVLKTGVRMLHSDTLLWFRYNQSFFAFFLFNAACVAEKKQIPILYLLYDPTGTRTTISHTRGEHANYYTNNAAVCRRYDLFWVVNHFRGFIVLLRMLQ